MAAVDMTDDQLKQYFGRPDFDSSILSQDEKQRLVKITEPGQSTTPAQGSGVDPDVDGTINFARDFTRGVGGQLSDSVSGILKGFRAIPDVVRNLADPTTREATTSGFKQGAVEGGKSLVDTFKDPIAMATGIGPQPTDTSFGEKLGRAAAGLGMVGVPAVLAHAGPAMFRGSEGGGILHGAEALADAESRIKTGGGIGAPEGAPRIQIGHGETTRTPFQPSLEAVMPSEAVGSKPATPATPEVAVKQPPTEKAPTPTQGVDDEPPAAAGEPPNRGLGGMSLQDQVFQDMMDQLHPEEDGPLPGNGTYKGANEPPVAEEPARIAAPDAPDEDPTLGDMRSMSGATEAAKDPRFKEAAGETDIPATSETVQDITGTPSRTPLKAETAGLDNEFMRHLMDERGSIQFGPKWESIKKALGFGGPEPEAISKDPFAMKDGPMDRRNFLYRASGAPKKLAKAEVTDFAKDWANPDNADKAFDRARTAENLMDKKLGVKPVLEGLDVGQDGTIDWDHHDKLVNHAEDLLNELSTDHPIKKKLDEVSEPYNALLLPAARAQEALPEINRTPSMLEAVTGETEKEFGQSVKEGSEGDTTPTPKAEDGTASLDDATTQLTFLDKLKKRLSDNKGSAQIVPDDWFEKYRKPARGGDDTGRSTRFTDEESDIIKERKAAKRAGEPVEDNPDLHTTRELDYYDPLTQKSGAIKSIMQMVEKLARGEEGSAQVAPEGWFKSKNKPIAGDASYTGDVKSMIDSDNIRQGAGSNDSWIRSTLDSRLKKLKDETGSFSPKAVVDVLNQVRVMSFLSGLAVPKSLLGNVNAVVTAAVERGDWAPIKEAFNLPQNAAELKAAWQSTANPGAIAGAGKINIPGRVMGALDETTQKALQRAGLSKDEGQRLLLQRPNPTGNANFGTAIKSPVGRFVWPFQRTPFNQLAEGISPDLVRDPGGSTAGTLRRAGMTLGTTAAGYELGQNTKDPRILGLAAALSGVRGVPMLLGAAMGGAGKNAVAGISPIPEWGIPSSPKDLIRLTGLDPAAIRAFGLDSGSSARKSGRASTRASRKAR